MGSTGASSALQHISKNCQESMERTLVVTHRLRSAKEFLELNGNFELPAEHRLPTVAGAVPVVSGVEEPTAGSCPHIPRDRDWGRDRGDVKRDRDRNRDQDWDAARDHWPPGDVDRDRNAGYVPYAGDTGNCGDDPAGHCHSHPAPELMSRSGPMGTASDTSQSSGPLEVERMKEVEVAWRLQSWSYAVVKRPLQ